MRKKALDKIVENYRDISYLQGLFDKFENLDEMVEKEREEIRQYSKIREDFDLEDIRKELCKQ